MAEGALEVETLSNTELGAGGIGSGGTGGAGGGSGAAGEVELPAQLDGQVDLHVDSGRELMLGATGVQSGEMEGDEIVTEPVLGMRMLMSSRVRSKHAGLRTLYAKATFVYHSRHTHVQLCCWLNFT